MPVKPDWIVVVIACILGLLILLFLAGCTVYWTDDAFYASVLTFKTADVVVYDSNTLHLQAYDLTSDPEKIQALTPYGSIKTGD